MKRFMKRLFTIFLSSVVGLGVWGQQIPMTIAGDMYIAPTGNMISEGTVHVKALSSDRVGRVANYGNMKLVDSIIFYTNDLVDGLLVNQDGAVITTPLAVVRKNFSSNNAWYMVSFPFDVDLNNGIFNPLTGEKLTRGIDFEVQFYNAEKRAFTGLTFNDNWTVIPKVTDTPDEYAGVIYEQTNQIMRKGIGYRVAFLFSHLDPSGSRTKTDYEVDFVPKTGGDVSSLFSRDAKGVDLTFASSHGTFITHFSEGWNAIGGLNSGDFIMKNVDGVSRTIEYPRTIYVWSAKFGEGGDWEEFYPGDPAAGTKTGILRPYAVIFTKTSEQMFLDDEGLTPLPLAFQPNAALREGEVCGGFTYFNDGFTLDNTADASTLIFRSSQSASYDMLKLQLADAKDESKASPVYFKFKDVYSRSYKPSEDDIMLTTSSVTRPIVWALAKEEGFDADNFLFVNCLPYGENEVPLGVNLPVAGEYIFSLKDLVINEPVKSAVLWDKVTNTTTELLKSDYPFQTNGMINTNDRFVLFFNRSMTSIDQPGVEEIYAYTDNNILTVKNLLSGDKVQVLDLTGRIIASGVASDNAFSANLNQKGVYIVNVRGGKTLKVLNK